MHVLHQSIRVHTPDQPVPETRAPATPILGNPTVRQRLNLAAMCIAQSDNREQESTNRDSHAENFWTNAPRFSLMVAHCPAPHFVFSVSKHAQTRGAMSLASPNQTEDGSFCCCQVMALITQMQPARRTSHVHDHEALSIRPILAVDAKHPRVSVSHARAVPIRDALSTERDAERRTPRK